MQREHVFQNKPWDGSNCMWSHLSSHCTFGLCFPFHYKITLTFIYTFGFASPFPLPSPREEEEEEEERITHSLLFLYSSPFLLSIIQHWLISIMDMYGTLPNPKMFRIDDLLDLSNEELFSPNSTSSSSTTTGTDRFPPPETHFSHISSSAAFNPSHSTDFTHELCVPSDDVAELEWLSRFVDDSFTEFPSNSLSGTLTVRNDASFPGRVRGKRSRAPMTESADSMLMPTEMDVTEGGKLKPKREAQPTGDGGLRRCTHCASEKTPQWRTGPLGPKTLCNACGVRYKSGRLVPEYRPASSPTFVLTQHSNSHRKVLELRRQKEMMSPQQQEQEQLYLHQRDFRVS